jgi:hypothetical protein
MAARTVYVQFSNDLGNTRLHLVESGLSHGEWNPQSPWDKLPPSIIEPGSGYWPWSSVSDGFLTGTQGWVRYYPTRLHPPGDKVPSSIPDGETIYIMWDNPFVGSNSFQISAPAPYKIFQDNSIVLAYQNTGNTDLLSFSLKGASDVGPTCIAGHVWRGAFPDDVVCVTPAERQQVLDDNAAAASHTRPDGQCKPGYVWREAAPVDRVCVTPETRTLTAKQNAEANQNQL